MNEDSSNIDLFDRYHTKQMDSNEEKDFEENLHANSKLEEEFELYKASLKLIDSNSIHEEVGNILRNEKSNRSVWIAVAASITALTLVSIFLLRKDSESLFEQHFEPYPNVISTRSIEKLNEGFDFYNKEFFESAEASFESLITKSDTVYFYLAMSQMSQGNAVSAIENLNEIDTLSIFYPQKLWYATLANIEVGKIQEAIHLLKQVEPNSYRYEESKELVSRLEKLLSSSKEEE